MNIFHFLGTPSHSKSKDTKMRSSSITRAVSMWEMWIQRLRSWPFPRAATCRRKWCDWSCWVKSTLPNKRPWPASSKRSLPSTRNYILRIWRSIQLPCFQTTRQEPEFIMFFFGFPDRFASFFDLPAFVQIVPLDLVAKIDETASFLPGP